jgi:c(7)-type cytochrome triheme protein
VIQSSQNQESESLVDRVNVARQRRGLREKITLAALLCLLSCVACLAFVRGGTSASVGAMPVASAAVVSPIVQGGGFSHATSAHAGISCASCHARSGNSPQVNLPGHKACTNCHMQQFVSAELGLCASCHTNLESGNPPVKAFPAMRSFNVRFDHAQHNGAACASCHTATSRRSAALSIPAGLSAHSNCFQCHSPGAQSGGRDIGSCSACHSLGGYSRTPAGGRAFRVSFTHAAHNRQGMNCSTCHSVRAGAPQGRQVTSTAPTQHFGSARGQSCMTCHNERRTFGGDDFATCKRCHKGKTFRF